jgi:hypothetical protein
MVTINAQLLSLIVGAVAALLLLVKALDSTLRGGSGYPLPPGPKGQLFIGNVFDMPTEQAWLTYARWGKIFGAFYLVMNFQMPADVFNGSVGKLAFVRCLGMPVVIINTYDVATALLDKRSAIYANRPTSVMLGEL